jgi:hypothetical protein
VSGPNAIAVHKKDEFYDDNLVERQPRHELEDLPASDYARR